MISWLTLNWRWLAYGVTAVLVACFLCFCFGYEKGSSAAETDAKLSTQRTIISVKDKQDVATNRRPDHPAVSRILRAGNKF